MRNTDILKTVADCDTALADARQTKSGLQIRLTNAQFALDAHETKTAELPGLLVKAEEKLVLDQERFTNAVSVDARELAELEVNSSENKLRDLQNMSLRYNPLRKLGSYPFQCLGVLMVTYFFCSVIDPV